MNFINCTPHKINIYNSNKELVLSLESSNIIPRVTITPIKQNVIAEIELYDQLVGTVINMPEEQENTILIVSAQTRLALPQRKDLASPGELIRDENGNPIGCIGLYKNW